MAPRMVTSFRRTLSFPNPPSPSLNTRTRKTLHTRSASLPTHSHYPIQLPHLRHEIAQLCSWSAQSDAAIRTSDWLCAGLRHIKALHESLDDLLQLPHTRDSLSSDLIEQLLQHFLRFVDVYGIFQTLILRLKEEFSAAQIAVRRKDTSAAAAHSKNLRKIGKDIGKLGSNLSSIGKLTTPYNDDDAELIGVINDVLKVTVCVSDTLFSGLSAFRRPAAALSFTKKVKIECGIREFQDMMMNLENLGKNKSEEEIKMAWKQMHETEDCIVEIQGFAEKGLRSLIGARVSLLNLLTQ